jgi:lipoprotein signal peptidase
VTLPDERGDLADGATSSGSDDRPAAGWGFLLAVVPVGVLLDQITKQAAHDALAPRGIVPVIDGVFMLRYSLNRGAFFSLGEDLPDSVRRGFFVVATLAAIGLIVHLYRRAQEKSLRWALVLLLTGAFGNLIDRVLYGEVVDFLHLHWQDAFHWATFNVADVFIAAGLVLLALDVVRGARRRPAAAARLEPEPSAKKPAEAGPESAPEPEENR